MLQGFNTGFVHTFNTKAGETSPGDVWTWHADVQDAASGDMQGELTGFAVNVPTDKWEKTETISLYGGDIFCHYAPSPARKRVPQGRVPRKLASTPRGARREHSAS